MATKIQRLLRWEELHWIDIALLLDAFSRTGGAIIHCEVDVYGHRWPVELPMERLIHPAPNGMG